VPPRAKKNAAFSPWEIIVSLDNGIILSPQFRCDRRTAPPFAKNAKGQAPLKIKFGEYAGHGKAGPAPQTIGHLFAG